MQSEEIFRKAIESSPVGIIMADAAGRIVVANAETERLFGYAQGELIGQTIDVLVPDAIRAKHAHMRGRFASGPQMRSGAGRSFNGRRKDGSEFAIEVGLNPIQTRDGPLVLASIVDISERKRIARLQDEFIATVSHELPTPLTSIIGALGLMAVDGRDTIPATTLRLLAIARDNARRLMGLVNGILDMEKIDSGKAVFTFECVDVRDVIGQAIEANRAAADSFGVGLNFDTTLGPVETRGDADWLLQVFNNLLSNAIKFSPHGGEGVIAIASRPGTCVSQYATLARAFRITSRPRYSANSPRPITRIRALKAAPVSA